LGFDDLAAVKNEENPMLRSKANGSAILTYFRKVNPMVIERFEERKVF
jgi:hypothetical protein